MEDQELMQKFQIFESRIMQTQEQLQAVEQGLLELNDLKEGLEYIKGKEGNEILAPIGRGVFVKAKLLSEELTVDVGERKFVNKSIEDTGKIIEEQLEKLNGVKSELENSLEMINQELTRTMIEHQTKKQKEESDCDCEHDHCGEDCDCEHDPCEDGCSCH